MTRINYNNIITFNKIIFWLFPCQKIQFKLNKKSDNFVTGISWSRELNHRKDVLRLRGGVLIAEPDLVVEIRPEHDPAVKVLGLVRVVFVARELGEEFSLALDRHEI